MFIPLWILIALAVLVLYRVGTLLKEKDRLSQEIARLNGELAASKKSLAQHQRTLADFHEHVKQDTKRAFNVRHGLRNVLGNGANPEVLKRLHEYVFERSATDSEFNWRD